LEVGCHAEAAVIRSPLLYSKCEHAKHVRVGFGWRLDSTCSMVSGHMIVNAFHHMTGRQ
jgi:hypothetical protein